MYSTSSPTTSSTLTNVTRTMSQGTLQNPSSLCRCKWATIHLIQPTQSPYSISYRPSKQHWTVLECQKEHPCSFPLLQSLFSRINNYHSNPPPQLIEYFNWKLSLLVLQLRIELLIVYICSCHVIAKAVSDTTSSTQPVMPRLIHMPKHYSTSRSVAACIPWSNIEWKNYWRVSRFYLVFYLPPLGFEQFRISERTCSTCPIASTSPRQNELSCATRHLKDVQPAEPSLGLNGNKRATLNGGFPSSGSDTHTGDHAQSVFMLNNGPPQWSAFSTSQHS